MARMVEKRKHKSGLPPGTLVHTGRKRKSRVKVTVIDYDATKHDEKVLGRDQDCDPFTETPTVTWINVDGVHDKQIIEKFGSHFGLHPLVMEDIMSTGQRPKVEDMGNYLYVVVKMLYKEAGKDEITAEQVSLIIGKTFVVSFQEREGDVFDAVRDRIRQSKGRIRQMGPDYLAYSLIDAVVDNYFNVLEDLGEKAELLEDEVIGDADKHMIEEIHDLKNELIYIRKCISPLREAANALSRGSDLISGEAALYFRDVQDHTIRVIESLESLRDLTSGLRDTYLTSISNRMNEVMKVLTIIATIFIPLTFVAGVYGMNFEYMPELKWPWAYPAVWMVMVAVGIGMTSYFRRKKWL